MDRLARTRFIAANYTNLQGLRAAPLGLLALTVGAWANAGVGPRGDLLVPILCAAFCLILFFLVDGYYKRRFGRVKQAPRQRYLEYFLGTAGAVLALAAFWVDVTFELPFSTVGVVTAAAFLADYARITWLVKGRSMPIYPLMALVMLAVSLLPVFGAADWWQAVGVRSPLVGVVMLIGLIAIIVGIQGHVYLLHALPPEEPQAGAPTETEKEEPGSGEEGR